MNVMDLKSKKGFSLIDVLVASMIIGTAMVGTTRAVTIALKAYKTNENQIYASLLYYSAAAYVKNQNAASFLTTGSTDNGDFTTDLGLTGIQTGWTWNYTVTALDNGDSIARKVNIKIMKGTSFSDTIPCIVFNDIWD